MKNNPTFTVFTGPMFSSKTSKLLMTLERYKYQKKSVAIFKPSLDNRYDAKKIVSHGGWTVDANVVKTGADILEILSQMSTEPDVVAIDEAFMISGVAEVLLWLYKNGVEIVVSTLDLSSTGKPFSEVEKLLVWATHVEKCTAVCTICSKDAYYTHKKQIDESDGEIQVGGSELYDPRCARHHPYIMNHEIIVNQGE